MSNSLTEPCTVCGHKYHTIHINTDTGGWYFECMRCGVHATLLSTDKLEPAEFPRFDPRMRALGRSLVEEIDRLFREQEGMDK